MKHYLLAFALMAIPACSDSDDDKDSPVAGNSETVPDAPLTITYETKNLSLNATEKSVWVYYGLREGELVSMKQDEPWIIGTSRYMWKTNTGSSGTFSGGAYEAKDENFEAISSCDASRFVQDIMVPPLGSVHEGITSKWWDITAPTPVPLDTQFVVGRDTECIKLKILSYDKGLYTLQFQRLK